MDITYIESAIAAAMDFPLGMPTGSMMKGNLLDIGGATFAVIDRKGRRFKVGRNLYLLVPNQPYFIAGAQLPKNVDSSVWYEFNSSIWT